MTIRWALLGPGRHAARRGGADRWLPEDPARAAPLPRLIRETNSRLAEGGAVPDALEALGRGLVAAGFSSVDYAELADAASLQSLSALGARPARLFVAARIGGTRLIDNVPVGA